MKRNIKEEISKDQIKYNLRDSLDKIKNLIYLSNPEVFGLPELYLSDYDSNRKGNNHELIMVMINMKFSTESEIELTEFIHTLTDIKQKLTFILNKVSFDINGILKPKTMFGTVKFSGSMTVDKIDFSYDNGDTNIVLDIFFYSDNY